MIRSKVDALADVPNVDETKAAWDFGGGAMFFFGTHVGLRVDLRYLRTFSALNLIDAIDRRGRLDFARASTGLTHAFPLVATRPAAAPGRPPAAAVTAVGRSLRPLSEPRVSRPIRRCCLPQFQELPAWFPAAQDRRHVAVGSGHL